MDQTNGDNMNDKDRINAICNSVFEFLNDRPVSVIDPAIDKIGNEMAKSLTNWLNVHEDEIINAIAARSCLPK